MSDSPIPFAGGTGKTAGRVARLLRDRGQDVRAVSRSSWRSTRFAEPEQWSRHRRSSA